MIFNDFNDFLMIFMYFYLAFPDSSTALTEFWDFDSEIFTFLLPLTLKSKPKEMKKLRNLPAFVGRGDRAKDACRRWTDGDWSSVRDADDDGRPYELLRSSVRARTF